jgi:hypothetical protein
MVRLNLAFSINTIQFNECQLALPSNRAKGDYLAELRGFEYWLRLREVRRALTSII